MRRNAHRFGLATVVVLLLGSGLTPFGFHSPAHDPTQIPRNPRTGLPALTPLCPAPPGPASVDLSPTSADSEPEILSALQSVSQAGGGTVRLSTGTFYLWETLVVPAGNVLIEGQGTNSTFLSMPPNPVGNFTDSDGRVATHPNGNVLSLGVHMIGFANATNHVYFCNLTLDANVLTPADDWEGSLLVDTNGTSHAYINIAEVNFFGPSPIPNGMHLAGTNYVVNGLQATSNAVPWTTEPPSATWNQSNGGPNFVNIAGGVGMSIANVTAIGYPEYDLAPCVGCTFTHWYVHGHWRIDTVASGDWGNSVFENLTIDSRNTPTRQTVLNVDTQNTTEPFLGMHWSNCTVYGFSRVGAADDVEGCRFYGGVGGIPSVFKNNLVVQAGYFDSTAHFPIPIGGYPYYASVTLSGNTFQFVNGTNGVDPFLLGTVPITWEGDTVRVNGSTSGYLLRAPSVNLNGSSTLNSLTYSPLDPKAPGLLELLDASRSPGFRNYGACVTALVRIADNLPAASLEVSGHVLNGSNDRPIAGAVVSLTHGNSTSTNPDGSYSLEAVQGSFELTAEAPGYAPQTVSIVLSESNVTQNFTLIPIESSSASVAGHVVPNFPRS
jgi:hypothetical protein